MAYDYGRGASKEVSRVMGGIAGAGIAILQQHRADQAALATYEAAETDREIRRLVARRQRDDIAGLRAQLTQMRLERDVAEAEGARLHTKVAAMRARIIANDAEKQLMLRTIEHLRKVAGIR
jgi:hypothetical protein